MIFDYQKKYDIAISGAGIAGISAALAAARRGHKVVLLEKQALIGGLATSGLIYIYLPLCDGNGTQVSFGITEELLRISTEFSPFDIPEKWNGPAKSRALQQERYQCEFSPAGFILSLDKLLRNANVNFPLPDLFCHWINCSGMPEWISGLIPESVPCRKLLMEKSLHWK